jgi:SAM-dependent methyltransferase
MAEPWNLTPQQWSQVLAEEVPDVGKTAKNLSRGKHLPWVDTLARLTEDSLDILDLGSGRGQNAAALALKEKRMTALDWSRDNLDFSGKLFQAVGKTAEFVQADMTKPLPFADKRFDAVFSCGVFEYFSDDEIRAILKETFRIVRKRVVIMVPNAWSVPYRVGMWYMRKTNRWPWGGERPFTTLRPYFRDIGITNVREFSVGARHSLHFLTMPGGKLTQRVLRGTLYHRDHPRPSVLNQGYLLIAAGEKNP